MSDPTKPFKDIPEKHYLVGKSFATLRAPVRRFDVVDVKGTTAYGWETSPGEELWTWYKTDELHEVKTWKML